MTARSKRPGATCASMTAPIRSDTGASHADLMAPSFKQAAAAARPGAAGAAPSLEQGAAHEGSVLSDLLTDSHCHVQASSEQELNECLHSYRASAVAHFNLYSTTLANAQRVAAALRALPRLLLGVSGCSTMVFQAPQAGHFPAHLGNSLPQAVQ